MDAYLEIWIEKDALAGVVESVTDRYDVPLMAARGYSSETYLYSTAVELEQQNRRCFIYHFGDFDPSGVNAAEKIEEGLRRLASSADITFERVAVTPAQIARWRLPTRPTKTTDSRAARWGGGNDSVELDAIPPNTLRDLVRECIERHMPRPELERLKAIEDEERQQLLDFLASWRENEE